MGHGGVSTALRAAGAAEPTIDSAAELDQLNSMPAAPMPAAPAAGSDTGWDQSQLEVPGASAGCGIHRIAGGLGSLFLLERSS